VQCSFRNDVPTTQNAHQNSSATAGHHGNCTAPAPLRFATDSIDWFSHHSGAPSPTTRVKVPFSHIGRSINAARMRELFSCHLVCCAAVIFVFIPTKIAVCAFLACNYKLYWPLQTPFRIRIVLLCTNFLQHTVALQEIPCCMESEDSLPCSQKPATSLCPGPVHHHHYFLCFQDPF
jgi:hypothetical protein